VRQYLKDVRDEQLGPRGAEASKKRKRRSKQGAGAGAAGGRGAGGAQQEPAASEGHSGSGGQSKDEGHEPLQRHSSAEQGRSQFSTEPQGPPSGLSPLGRPAEGRPLRGPPVLGVTFVIVYPACLALLWLVSRLGQYTYSDINVTEATQDHVPIRGVRGPRK